MPAKNMNLVSAFRCFLFAGMIFAAAMPALASTPAGEALLYTARIKDEGDSGDGDFELFLNTADGQTVRLTDNDMDDCDPHWHGGKIVFERGNWDWDEPAWQIWLLDPLTGEERLIVECPDDAYYVYNPKLSPDGSRLLYWVMWRDREVSETPHILNLDTGELKSPGLPGERRSYARWTPEGDGIVFVLKRDEGDAIAVMDVQTLNVADLVPPSDGMRRYDPAVAPGGGRVAFQETDSEAEVTRIRVMDLATGIAKTVCERREAYWDELNPEWAPSGEAIYFNSKVEGASVLSRVVVADQTGESVIVPESDWVGIPSAAYFPGFAPSLVLRAVASGSDWIRLEATPAGLTAPVEYEWSFVEGASWCKMEPEMNTAIVSFDLPSLASVRVTATGSAGKSVDAVLEIEPPQAE